MANEKDDQRKIASETIESLKIAQQAIRIANKTYKLVLSVSPI